MPARSRRTSRKASRRSRKTSRKTSRRSRKTSKGKSAMETRCKNFLKKKIKENIIEYSNGLQFVSRQQAIAVSYSQAMKKYPTCAKLFGKKFAQ